MPNQKIYNSRAEANKAVSSGTYWNKTIKYKTLSGNVVTRQTKSTYVEKWGGEGPYNALVKRIVNTNENIAAKKANAAKKKANNNAAHMAIVYNSRAAANNAVNNGIHKRNSTIKYKTPSGNVVTKKLVTTQEKGVSGGNFENSSPMVNVQKITNINA